MIVFVFFLFGGGLVCVVYVGIIIFVWWLVVFCGVDDWGDEFVLGKGVLVGGEICGYWLEFDEGLFKVG